MSDRQFEYLCSSITWNWSPGVVPQALVWSCYWFLVMVTMSDNERRKARNREELEQHDKTKANQIADCSSYAALSNSSKGKFKNCSSTMTKQLVGGSFTRPTMSPQSYRGEQVVPGNQQRTGPVRMPDPSASSSNCASSGA